MASDRGMYSIGALSRMLGVSATTLRSWEERYQVVIPERSVGAQRLYSREQLEQLRFVCAQMEIGLSAADAHRLLAERIENASTVTADVVEPGSHRIVLVERDPYAADLTEYFLRTEGYSVAVARTAADGQRFATDELADLVVIDCMIDGGRGLALCERIRGSVPVVAVSALDQRERALAAGAEAFLRKPLEPLTLVSAVRDLIGTSAIVRSAHRAPSA